MKYPEVIYLRGRKCVHQEQKPVEESKSEVSKKTFETVGLGKGVIKRYAKNNS